jgi:hypothetical protein
MTHISEYDVWYCQRCDKYSRPNPEFIPSPMAPQYQGVQPVSQQYIPPPTPQYIPPQQYTPPPEIPPPHYEPPPISKPPPPEPKSKAPKKAAAVVVAIIIVVASLSYYLFFMPTDEEDRISIYDVSDMRGLEVKHNVPVSTLNEEEILEMMMDMLGPEEMESLEELRLILDALFLYDYDNNLTQELLDAQVTGVMGFYVPATNEIVLVEGYSDLMDDLTLSHEFTHALQDQHFDLQSFKNGQNGDESMAREALYEGDATLILQQYLLNLSYKDQMAILEEMMDIEDPSEEVPYALQELILFQYNYGLEFVTELYDDGGWEAVNQAYDDPPESTEQIMHIYKYRYKEAPLDVSFDEQVDNMTLILEDTLGEFMIYIMLDHYLSSVSAESAASGWGGDRFYYYQNETDFLSVFKIHWDSVGDANQFYNAYQNWIYMLPYSYERMYYNGQLQIVQEGEITTIYHSSSSYIIEGLIR